MSKSDPAHSPLLALMRSLPETDKKKLATWSKTSVSYLYHLAAGSRTPSLALADRIVKATERMHERTEQVSAVLRLEDLLKTAK